MTSTPTKDSSNYFTPKELPTPTKDHSGVTKTIFTHISNLHGLLNDWDKLQLKGKKICRSISSIKLHEFQDNYYPHEVKVLVETLLEVVDGLHDVCAGIELLDKQINSLSKLQPLDTPLMQTWTASQISENVSNLHDSFKQEFHLKKTILGKILITKTSLTAETRT
ncbi:uncharacterized protein LOC121733116 isoform X2 [Aricia agestis]|uniref:uncharacterized protein LOC121733116 isoform X2 n=1 Tax=Aricia agestis TaxID=91739 RepID=UPI001C208D0F|nr:uncharacterized protein LOC121733116 isoform X2 [Aricia agestis]